VLGIVLANVWNIEIGWRSRVSTNQSSQLELNLLTRIAARIDHVGVAGNEADLQFDAQTARASLAALQAELNKTGHNAGELVLNTLTEPHDGMDTLIYDTARFQSQVDAEQAWERDFRGRWHDQIETRANDWIERLRKLRSDMAAWLLPVADFNQLSIVDQAPVPMSEELMQRFGVAPKMMPTFEIRAEKQRIMRFQPKGLWIIGANGRVDLITKAAAPILVDRSEPLSNDRDWQLYDSGNHGRSIPLTEDAFLALVRAGL
jgi:hypothetical protein